ncbi:MAG: pantetheine-phosphate adenylyltransferase [Vicinamibacteria bacterium]|nr:pantetheine-phosphate adenylyltransferase [Vicinamibacteria bacterium]
MNELVERIAVCPGSFDPLTNGHVDLVTRAARLFDRVVVAILVNEQKTALLSETERLALAREVFAGERRVRVDTFDGLLVDFAGRVGATAIVRGLRSAADFQDEWPMAVTNRHLQPGVETVFLVPAPEVSAISSRLVKEIWRLGGDISGLVPGPVETRMRALGPVTRATP